MITKCPFCGASLDVGLIEKAIAENKNYVECPYCNNIVEFRKRDITLVEHGYEYLSIGAFDLAIECFDREIKFEERKGKTPAADVYLGKALAEFNVQVEFDGDYASRDTSQRPRITCQHYNKEYFVDNLNYKMALDVIDCEFEYPLKDQEFEWFEYYAKTIDDVKDYYDEISRREGGKSYDLFVAYDDDQTEGRKARKYSDDAIEIYNEIPRQIKNKFMANPAKRDGDELRYEAEILYAIEHSKCMLVVVEENIGSRLRNIYSRFYNSDGKKDRNLAFVRMEGHFPIALPDHHNADDDHIFGHEPGKKERDVQRMINFVYRNNGIFVEETEETEDTGKDEGSDKDKPPVDEVGDTTTNNERHYHYLDPKHVAFGYYPQKREEGRDVLDYFEGLGLPSRREYHDWKVLFINKKGQPTWYRDEVVNGKKYRAIYFDGFRDLYSVQDSDVAPTSQTAHHYGRKELYCFSFEPLVWVIEKKGAMQLTLVSESGIDAREYSNDESMSNEWVDSTLRQWLNHDFLDTAFKDSDAEILCSFAGDEEGDKVYLMDKDADKEFYKQDIVATRGTDYYQCIGGRGEDSTVEKYWINNQGEKEESEASVVTPKYTASASNDYVDSTGVAVLPKIIITRDPNDDEE